LKFGRIGSAEEGQNIAFWLRREGAPVHGSLINDDINVDVKMGVNAKNNF
jgi:hypothetical protein